MRVADRTKSSPIRNADPEIKKPARMAKDQRLVRLRGDGFDRQQKSAAETVGAIAGVALRECSTVKIRSERKPSQRKNKW